MPSSFLLKTTLYVLFGALVFGPILVQADIVSDLKSEGLFHNIDGLQAEELLKANPPDSYLFRPSSRKGYFVFTINDGNKLKHQLLKENPITGAIELYIPNANGTTLVGTVSKLDELLKFY